MMVRERNSFPTRLGTFPCVCVEIVFCVWFVMTLSDSLHEGYAPGGSDIHNGDRGEAAGGVSAAIGDRPEHIEQGDGRDWVAILTESSIRDGDFEGARMTLEKLENPKLFSRDIYYLWE